jgi:hypothetical protein
MNSYTHLNQLPLEQQRRHLEGLIQAPTTSSYDFGKAVRQLGQNLVHWLTSGTQLRITQTQQGDRTLWKVQDPIDQQVLYFDRRE